jgi:hypothetical protein
MRKSSKKMIEVNRGLIISVLAVMLVLISLISPAIAQTASDAVVILHFDEDYGTIERDLSGYRVDRTFYGLSATSVGSLPWVAPEMNLSRLKERLEALSFEFELPDVPENLEIDLYIVYGSKLDTLERLVLDSLSSDALIIKPRAEVRFEGTNITKEIKINKKLFQENETHLESLRAGISLIILVGGRTHNGISAEVYDAGYITNESTKYMDQLIIGKGKIDTDSNVMVVSHRVVGEGERLERESVKYSPLSYFVPEEYVPVVATGIGMLIILLIPVFKTVARFLIEMTQEFFEERALDIGRKRITFGYTGPQIRGIHLKEVGAILGAAFILGLGVTWTFTGPTTKFFDLISLIASICLFAGLSHELTHRIIGRHFGIEMEYRFWYSGAFIAILTAVLGNSFGIPGFLLEKGEVNIRKEPSLEPSPEPSTWKYGVTKLAAPIISTIITVTFAFLFIQNPGVIFQMIYTTAGIWAMAEIMPAKGMDGHDVKRWNRRAWFIFFILIVIIYFTLNFIQ